MFESLSDRLQNVFARLGSRGRLSEADVDEALKEVRRALLEADVNFKVVRDFVARVREQAVGQDITKSLTPAQMVVKIVNDELVHLLGDEVVPLVTAQPGPTVLLLVGLNGAGKTTMAAKLALMLRKKHRNPLLVAADVYRPAAIKQLQTLGAQIQVPVYQRRHRGRARADRAARHRRGQTQRQPGGDRRYRRPDPDRRSADAGAGARCARRSGRTKRCWWSTR